MHSGSFCLLCGVLLPAENTSVAQLLSSAGRKKADVAMEQAVDFKLQPDTTVSLKHCCLLHHFDQSLLLADFYAPRSCYNPCCVIPSSCRPCPL